MGDDTGSNQLVINWEISSDNASWEDLITSDSLLISKEEKGNYIRSNIEFIDNSNTAQTITTQSVFIPIYPQIKGPWSSRSFRKFSQYWWKYTCSLWLSVRWTGLVEIENKLDSNLFEIFPGDELSESAFIYFKEEVNYEVPQDFNLDNIYEIELKISDSLGNSSRNLLIFLLMI